MALNDPKHEAFARFLAEGRSKRDAAIAAGYSEKSASTLGGRLCKVPAIAARIEELQQKAADLSLERAQVSRERVLAEYAKLAFLDIRKAFGPDGTLVPITEMDPDVAAAIAGLEVEIKAETLTVNDTEAGTSSRIPITVRLHKIKLADKKGALDSLARHLGMFIDRKEIRFPKLSELSEEELRGVLADLGEDENHPGDPAGTRPAETPA